MTHELDLRHMHAQGNSQHNIIIKVIPGSMHKKYEYFPDILRVFIC